MSEATAGVSLLARVVATFGRHSLVRAADSPAAPLLIATRRGKRGDVVVGDLVRCTLDGDQAAIESIEPRRSLLFRADAHRVKELAANIDLMAIVFAPRPPFNPHFIWRALAAAQAAGIAALAVLNKTDITDGLELARNALAQAAQLGVATLAISAKATPAEARAQLAAATGGRATLLVGQSGMGKSTLLNLRVDANARTQEYSTRLNVGKQTTTASRWFDIPAVEGGGALIDTPGFTAFGLAHLSLAQRAAALPDFVPYLGQCRFNDCRHLTEPGCAINAAVQRGAINPARYAFYAELAAETLR
ncbi:MAG: ribosome small subunit-dependent GTPase A [Burkholderiaceae bacterium]|nr:ribosome small subunit-dependent GTPase A [Burkholderiaceae bacterium]